MFLERYTNESMPYGVAPQITPKGVLYPKGIFLDGAPFLYPRGYFFLGGGAPFFCVRGPVFFQKLAGVAVQWSGGLPAVSQKIKKVGF